MESTVFVFYTMAEGSSWSYSLPKGWWWVGAGSPMTPKYEREEQFQGPAASRTKTMNYLDSFFKKLKKQGIIKTYKVSRTFGRKTRKN